MKPRKLKSLKRFWILLSYLSCPWTSNRRWLCINDFLGRQLWKGIFIIKISRKNLVYLMFPTLYNLLLKLCLCDIGEWLLLGEGYYNYQQFSSINLMYFCALFLLISVWRFRQWTLSYCQIFPDTSFDRLVLKHLLFECANVIKFRIHTLTANLSMVVSF